MKKLAAAGLVVVAVLMAGSYFLLNTGAGLRWVLAQALTWSGAPVRIGEIEGTLTGPVSLSGVRYEDPETGAAARIESLTLEWQPGALVRGVLHITRLRGAGIHYTPGSGDESPAEKPSIPDLSFPLAVQLDRMEVEAVTVGGGPRAAVVVGSASLQGSLDSDALVLEAIRVDAPRYALDRGRIRIALSDDLPVEAALTWRAQPEGMPAAAGRVELAGALRGTLEPKLELSRPFTAHGEGSISQLLEVPRWQMTVEVPQPVVLDGIVPQWPAAAVRGRVRSEGDMQRARIRPDVSIEAHEMDLTATLTGDAEVTRQGVTVDNARLARPDTDQAMVFSGHLNFDDPRSWTLDAGVSHPVALNEIVPAWPALSIQGDVSGRGDETRAVLEPDLSLAFRDIEARLTGETEVTRQALAINRASLVRRGADDAVDFSGRLEFAESLPWSLDARLPQPVALNDLVPGWPEISLEGDIRSRGERSRAEFSPELALAFRELAATFTGEIEVSQEALTVAGARLAQKDTDGAVAFSGRLGFAGTRPFRLQGEWQALEGPRVSGWSSRRGEFEAEGDADALTASLSGTVTPPDTGGDAPVSLEVNARGLRAELVVAATAEVPYLALPGLSVRELSADVDLRDVGGGPSKVRVTASSIDFGERRVRGVDLRADGTLERHEATLTGRLDDWSIDAAASGSYGDERWRGRLHRLDAESAGAAYGGPWKLDQPAEVVVSASQTEVRELCMTFQGSRLCGSGRQAGGEWNVDASAKEVPLRWLAVDSPEPMRIDGTVSAEASVGNRGGGIEGNAQARIDRASVDWQGDDPVETTYRDVVFSATLNERELRTRLDGKVDESGTIQGEVTTADPLAGNGAIRGSLSLDLPSLRVVQAVVPALGLREGRARIDLNIDGSRRSPRFSGDGRVSGATVRIEALGIELTDLQLDITSEGQRRLNLDARAGAGDGTLSARGFIEWPDEGGWRGEVRVTGSEAELARLPRALIDGNPDLTVTLNQNGGTVSGRIRLTRARLTPEAGRAEITISRDIVVVGEEHSQQPTRNPMAWHIDVTIELGDQVTFKGYGVKGRLSGSLTLNAPPRQPTRANGGIEIHDGEYSLYGRTFDIRRGRIVYTGGPIDNPGIDVQVGRNAGEVNVTLSVTGPLLDPSLNLSANQSMSDTDKMSYLLLGRPASEASEAEAGLLLRAAASLLPGDRGGGVPAYVQSTLGLDTLELRADSPESEGASVELGKYLSPKLYISYVAGFQQAVDVFRVRYELARHWLIRAESSTRESGGDLLFTW